MGENCKCNKQQASPVSSEKSIIVLPYVLGDIALSEGQHLGTATATKFFTDRIQEVLSKRAEEGKEKYGTYLTTFNGRDAVRDFAEELFDGLFYLKQMELEGTVSKKEYLDFHEKILSILVTL